MRRAYWTLAVLVCAACGSEQGTPINAPSIEPPVTRNMPSGFSPSTMSSLLGWVEGTAHAATDVAGALSDMDSRVFGDGNGPSHFREQLRQVDERMASLDRRAAETPKACLNSAPTEWTTPSGFFPHDANYGFVLQLQCYEELSESLHMAFGTDSENFYLLEASVHEGDSMLTLARARMDGTAVEIWRVGSRPANTQSNYLFVRATDGQGIEFAYGGHTEADGTSCGMRVRNDDSVFYTEGVFSDALNQPGDCSEDGARGGPGEFRFCASSGDISEAELTDCSGVSDVTDIPDLNYTVLGIEPAARYAAVATLVAAPGVDQLIPFSRDAE